MTYTIHFLTVLPHHILRHPLPQLRIRHWTETGLKVVFHMFDASRRRDHAGHRGMRDDEFQKELRPGMTADLARIRRQLAIRYMLEELALFERPIDQHADAAFLAQRQ